MKKVKCPFCGYEMPITYNTKAVCKEVFVRCKGRNCRQVFQLQIGKPKEEKQEETGVK